MRVLYIAHATSRDGASIALLNIIRNIRNCGVEIGVLLPEKKGYLYDELLEIGVKVFCQRGYPSVMHWKLGSGFIPTVLWFLNYSKIILGVHKDVYNLIKQFKPDIVHTNTSCIDYALLGCFFTHTPHVWHIREILFEDRSFKMFPSRNFIKMKFRLPFNHSIAISKYVYDIFNLESKDSIIYDGAIDDEDTNAITKERVFDYPYFITAGYVSTLKKTFDIMQAFAEFARKNSTHHLVIAGKYEFTDEYFKKCIRYAKQKNILNRVHFLGIRDDVKLLINQATALISACPYEGFGLTVAEAMHEGTLVIGINKAGVKDQFDRGVALTGGEIGYRFESIEQLSKSMSYSLLSNNKEIRVRAKMLVDSEYTVKNNADKIFEYYRSILSR